MGKGKCISERIVSYLDGKTERMVSLKYDRKIPRDRAFEMLRNIFMEEFGDLWDAENARKSNKYDSTSEHISVV